MEKTLNHLAVIMDGNRRWAKKQGLQSAAGYREGGFGAVKRTILFCIDRSIKHLSLYTFSLENFRRPQYEQDLLFDTIVTEGTKALPFFNEHNIKVQFIGDRTQFPEKVLPTCQLIEEGTKNNTGCVLNFLFCYGARQEMICGIKKLVHKIKTGMLKEDEITEDTFNQCLWTQGTPEPELIIRTSGAKRLSNFLLYQAAYSEFYFLDCLWPEVTEEHLAQATAAFTMTQRNFGV